MHYPKLLTRSMAACFTSWLALAPLPATALSLGELAVSSHLGQPFRAQISIKTGPNEAVDESCVSLSRPTGSADSLPYLSKAKISIEGSGNNQVIRLRTTQQINDPVLKLFLHITCGGQTSLSREFTLFLDPQDYAAGSPAPEEPVVTARSSEEKQLVRPGMVWTTQPGDSLDTIAGAIYPNQRNKQRRLKQAIVGANPQLFKNGVPVELPVGESIAIPTLAPRAAHTIKTEALAPAPTANATVKPNKAQERKAQAASPAQASFQLKLSAGELDLSASQNMTEEERLKLREKQMLLEADDQVASILTLKNRVKQLETQLTELSLKMSGGMPAAAQPAEPSTAVERKAKPAITTSAMLGEGMRYFWFGLGGISLALAAFFGLRRHFQSRDRDEAALEQLRFDAALAAAAETEAATSDSPPAPAVSKKTSGNTAPATEEKYYDPRSIFNPPEENITLTEVESVIEEADLYLIYGWTQKAVDLLQSHINKHPEEIQPWFMLFDTLRTQGAKDAFDKLARRFKETFADPVEWQKVQSLGHEFDPKNSLYCADPAQLGQATNSVEKTEPEKNAQETPAKEEPLDFWASSNHDFSPNMQARIRQAGAKPAVDAEKPLPNILDFERKEQRDK